MGYLFGLFVCGRISGIKDMIEDMIEDMIGGGTVLTRVKRMCSGY